MDTSGLRALHETILILSEEKDFDSALPRIFETVGNGLGFEIGEFWRYDAGAGAFAFHDAFWSLSEVPPGYAEASRATSIRAGQGVPGQVLDHRKPLVLHDLSKSDIVLRSAIFESADIRSLVALPVFAGEEPLGVLKFLDRAPHPMPETDLLRVLDTLAGQIGEFARRTRAESEARSRATLLQNVLDKIPVGVFIKDRRGVYRFANEALGRMNGRPAEQIIGLTDADLFPPEMAADNVNSDRLVLETGEVLEREIQVGTNDHAPWSLVRKVRMDGHEEQGFEICGIVADITREKTAEEALRRSEERFRQALEAAQEAVWEWNAATGEVTANDLWFRQLGLEPGEIEPSADTWDSMVHPDDIDTLKTSREAFLTGEVNVNGLEHRIITKSGEVRWIRSSGVVVEREKSGLPRIMVGTTLDITDTKRAEAALSISEVRLRQALEASRQAVWDWNLVTGKVIANDLWFSHYGYLPGEVPVGYEFWVSTLHPDDRDRVVRRLRDVLDGQSDEFSSEHRILTKSGEARWQKSVGSLVERSPSGEPLRMVGTNLDITDHKQAEEKLLRRETFQRAVLESAGEAIVAASDTGLITLFNSAAENLLGYLADEMVGLKTPEAFHDPDEIRRRAESLTAELGLKVEPGFEVFVALAKQGEPETREWTFIRKDGSRVPVLLTVSALREPGGAITGFLGIARDISERKKAEADLLDSELKLSIALQLAKAGQWTYDILSDRFTFTDNFYAMLRTNADAMGGYRMSSAEYAERFLLPEDRYLVADGIRNAIETSDTDFAFLIDHKFRYADGEIGYMAVKYKARKDETGRTTQAIGVNQDITERKRAEEALALSESRYRLAMQAAQEAVWEWDIRTGEVIANHLWYTHFGYDVGEVPSTDEIWRRTLHPEDRDEVFGQLQDYLEGRCDTYDNEHRVVVKSGEVRWHRSTGVIVERDEIGKPTRMIGSNMDITDRKRFEAELESSELRYRLAIQASQMAIWDCDLTTGNVSVNDLWYRHFDYDPDEVSPTFDTWIAGIHPEEREFAVKHLQDYVGGRIAEYAIEYRSLRKSGEIRWFSGTGMIVERAADGTPTRIIGTNVDITDRKRMEAALEKSEVRHRLAMRAAREAIWEWNLRTGEGSADDLWFDLLGYQPGEIPLTEEGWKSVLHTEDRDLLLDKLKDYLEGRTSEFVCEHRVIVKSGEVRWHRGTGMIVERDAEGRPVRLIGTSMDITDRKRAELQLIAALKRLRMATGAAKIAIWAWNFADDSLEWDSRMFEIYGIDPNDFRNGIGYDTWLNAIHPDDKDKTVNELIASKELKDPVYREFRIVRPDGSVRHVQAASVVEFDAGGKAVQLIGINRDITQQRESETSLREAKTAAEAANLAKSRFLAAMSHEVRTPLTAVLGYADMLTEPSVTPAEATEAVNSIRRNGQHLLTILDNVLDLSKIEASRMLIESIPFSPWQIAFDAITILKMRAADKRIRITSAPLSPLPDGCLLDPTRVRQILLNLIANSIKFTEPGGMIELNLRCDSDAIVFEVNDTGIGMSQAEIAHIFEPFSQADASTTRRFGGSGLGLTITRKLVELMNGTISVTSEQGKGSQFVVRLPLIWPPDQTQHRFMTPQSIADLTAGKHESRPPMSVPRFRGRILLADDSDDNRRVILHLLKRHGLKADVAVNGREASEVASRSAYDLILMDMQMPEMDGFEATRLIRHAGLRLPIIALTASTMTQDRIKAFEAGCTEYLSKPLEPKAFQEVLARFLDAAPRN